MPRINPETVNAIFEKNATAEALGELIGHRAEFGRNAKAGITTLTALNNQIRLLNKSPIPQDLLLALKDLDQAGIGKLRGDQFKWSFPLKDVGKVLDPRFQPKKRKFQAMSTKKTVVEPSTTKPEAPAPEAPKAIPTNVVPLKTKSILNLKMVICLDKTREVTVQFPSDISDDEVMFVIDKILKTARG